MVPMIVTSQSCNEIEDMYVCMDSIHMNTFNCPSVPHKHASTYAYYTHASMHTHSQTLVYTHTKMNTFIHTQTLVCTYLHIHTHNHTRI